MKELTPLPDADCLTCRGGKIKFNTGFCGTCQRCAACGKVRAFDSHLCPHHILMIEEEAAREEAAVIHRQNRRERKAALRKALKVSPLSCPQRDVEDATYSR